MFLKNYILIIPEAGNCKMCIIRDYWQIIAHRELGLQYSEMQIPRKKLTENYNITQD